MSREVLVNGRFLSRRVTGVERHGREILSLKRDSCRVESTRAHGWRGHLWEQLILPRTLNRNSVLWSPANTGPVMVANQALTLHDLSPLEHPGWFRKSFAAWYRLFLPILIRRVQLVFTPSRYVQEKIRRRFGIENTILAPNGVDMSTFHPAAKQEWYDLPEKYILFVGTLEPRKNILGLLQAWKEVQAAFKDTWLIIAGTYGHVFGSLHLPADVDRVRFLGYVENGCLPGLYAGATIFVLPSLDEGFGLPALEAMACGVPVITSDGGALPEIVGGAGAIFRLSEPGSLSVILREHLSDEQIRYSMRVKGLERAGCFSWARTADIIWNSLHEI
jgi:glycosyltransferase involved in cell wall biosynthesis